MQSLNAIPYMRKAMPSWRRLLRHCVRFAASRALASVGSRIEISSAMMPMTTSNSTSVKPLRGELLGEEREEGGNEARPRRIKHLHRPGQNGARKHHKRCAEPDRQ